MNSENVIIATLPKSFRLRKRTEFLSLSVSPHKQVSSGFLVVWMPNTLGHPRLGVTVSKKIGNAVVRNRIRRYVREIFRHVSRTMAGTDINVIARRGAAHTDYQTAVRELTHVFRRIVSQQCVITLPFFSSMPTGS